MYSHCLFCRASLGANESIEVFPVGKRLAFDAAKGRLWVVCPACAQWNLSPLEERWEAVETCEQRFRDTKRRVQGEQVGLARLPDGLELVRIGRPQRPEFAAWRYGDQFNRRAKAGTATAIALGGATGLGLLFGLPAVGLASLIPTIGFIAGQASLIHTAAQGNRKIPHPEGGEALVTINERGFVRLVEKPESEGGWGLVVPYQRIVRPGDPWWKRTLNTGTEGNVHLTGAHALRAAELLLPQAHRWGVRPAMIDRAVSLIEDAGSPEAWFRTAAKQTRKWAVEQTWGDTGAVAHLPKPVKLALEMASQEEAERRALEGELADLEARWKEAEEVAAIADNLLLPAGVTEFLQKLRVKARG